MPGTAVPAYFLDPAQHLDLLAARPELVVLNPDSGPGATPHVAYRSLARRLTRSGATVLWYLHLEYARRPMAAVREDLARYAAWYPFAGVLLDEIPSDLRGIDGRYVRRCLEMARAAGAETIALNPGTAPVHVPFDGFDVLVTFEGDLAAYRSRDVEEVLAPEAGWRVQPAGHRWREWHLVHNAPINEHAQTGIVAGRRGADLVYVTEQRLPNPWGQLARVLREDPLHRQLRRSSSNSRVAAARARPAAL